MNRSANGTVLLLLTGLLAFAPGTPAAQPAQIDSLRRAAQPNVPQAPDTVPSREDQPQPPSITPGEPAADTTKTPDRPETSRIPTAAEDRPPEGTGADSTKPTEAPSSIAGYTQTASRVAPGGDKFGFAIAATGDLDGDGVGDFAAGAFAADSGGDNAGCVLVISGASGDTLYHLTGGSARENLGYAVATADINGDRIPDLIVGAPHFSKNDSTAAQVGRVYTFSGADGSPLRRIDGLRMQGRLGYTMASAGDVDQDGRDDIAVSEQAYSDSATSHIDAVHIYSSKDGSLLRTYKGTEIRDRFGGALADAGDLNGDGVPDLIVGARRHSAAAVSAGRVYVFSGQTGDILHTLDGDHVFQQFGAAVARLGDIDGDGINDFAVGAPATDEGAGRGGAVYVYSGANASLLRRHVGSIADQQLGCALAGCGDLDGDGIPDLIVGAGGRSKAGKSGGAAYAISGSDARVLHTFTGAAAGDNFGRAVAAPGDLNGDGTDDLLIGAFGNDDNGIDAGIVNLYSGRDWSLLASFTGTSTLAVADTVKPEKPATPIIAAATDTPRAAGEGIDTAAAFVMPDTVYTIPELDNPPFLRRTLEAVYPESEIASGATGWVQVRVLVMNDGLPGLIEIADDDGLGSKFRQAAVEAARQWEFAPATKGGKDVASWMVVPIGFAPPAADTTGRQKPAAPRDTTIAAPQIDTSQSPPGSVIRPPADSVTRPPAKPDEPADTTKNYEWSDVDQQPKLVQQVNPEYPVKALEDRDTGTVMLRVLVLRDGSVGDAKAGRETNPGKGFDQAAIRAAKRWRFEAGTKAGQTVNVWVNYPLRFTLPE